MKYPVPAGGWPGNQPGKPGSLYPAKEENNITSKPQNDSGNQEENNAWGNTANSNNDGNTGNDNNANQSGWDNNNNGDNNQPLGDNTGAGWGDQQPDNQQQDQTGDNNGAWGDNNNNNDNQNNDQQPQNNSGGGWDDNNGQNNQTQAQGNWDNNNANANTHPQQPTQDWPTQPSTGAPQSQPQLASSRTTRPLYGPYGAYYSTTATALSPAAEAEEEPPFDVPETIAAARGTTHQVQPGKGYLYLHKRASPQYVDGIEEPYARFVFKYCTKGMIFDVFFFFSVVCGTGIMKGGGIVGVW
jgi:hypothetical protein